ncbi:MAG: HAD family hydrolase [Bacteroidota bacterium]
MDKKLITKANNPDINYIFFDYYDTVIHRRVHPLQPFITWAKQIKQEFGLMISSKDLYSVRRKSIHLLSAALGVSESEISYEKVIRKIYETLIESEAINRKASFELFLEKSLEADYQSESSIQYANKKTLDTLKFLKKQGYKIYCVSDFHSDEVFMKRLLSFHGIDRFYDKVFVSAAQNASKENKGRIFKVILEKEGISPKEVLMVGDNPQSDVEHAKLHGIESHYLKRNWYKMRQKLQFIIFSLRFNFI